jgi:hypothetical protein
LAYMTSVTGAYVIDRTHWEKYFSISLQICWKTQDGQSWSLLCSVLEKLDWNVDDSGRPKKVGADFDIPQDLNIVVLGNGGVPCLASQSIM